MNRDRLETLFKRGEIRAAVERDKQKFALVGECQHCDLTFEFFAGDECTDTCCHDCYEIGMDQQPYKQDRDSWEADQGEAKREMERW